MTTGQGWLFVAAAVLIALAVNTLFALARRRHHARRARTRTERTHP